jgi:hypothetical protein
MHNINDSIHQLFSTLLGLSRENTAILFESIPYQTGSGCKLISDYGESQYHLIENIGPLGFSHPLKIKSSLVASFTTHVYSPRELTEALIKNLESFFSNIVGFDLFICDYDIKNKNASAPGRYSSFFHKNDLSLLETHNLNINYLLPFQFSLSRSSKSSFVNNLTSDQVIYSKAIYKLLNDGQFYNGAKLIQKRSKKLEKKLSPLNFISEINGLTIKINKEFDLNKLKSKNIICEDHLFVLPIFYSDSDLDDIITILQEEFKCL